MMSVFLWALAGGGLIGLAAVMLMRSLGRIMGVSGIVAGLFANGDRAWRVAFLLGMAVPAVLFAVTGHLSNHGSGMPLPIVLIAGFLVGLGTRMGSGCTSGHGICGLSRFSLRSLVAVMTFMAVAVVTVTLIRHVL